MRNLQEASVESSFSEKIATIVVFQSFFVHLLQTVTMLQIVIGSLVSCLQMSLFVLRLPLYN